jgi:hypothetical protein
MNQYYKLLNVRHRNHGGKPNGITAVEFAMAFPLLMLFIFGSMEFARANMLRNTCENAALEGARAGMVPGATAQGCVDAASELLDILGIQNAVVTINPPVIDPSTENVEVTVSIPLTENSLPMARFVLGATMQQTATLPRESTH